MLKQANAYYYLPFGELGVAGIVNQPTIDYVAAIEMLGSGSRFNPHATIGVAPKRHLDELIARPFAEFSLSPAGAAVFKLGNLGTASQRLHTFADSQ